MSLYKSCRSCCIFKAAKEFSKSDNERFGLRTYCKLCEKKSLRKWRADNPERAKKSSVIHRLKSYGLTEKDYQTLLVNQNFKCAICKASESGCKTRKGLFVDHCHKTGLVRGLLCHYCNIGLGKFRDKPNILRLAAEYVEKIAV